MKIETVNLNKENLITIKEIDDKFYDKENLDLNFYLKRYNANHSAYFFKNANKVVGYIVSVPIKKELYNVFKKGIITNDIYINNKMFIDNSRYNYISSICILEEYRNKGYGKQLFESFLKNIDKGKYIALAINESGYQIASKYMKVIKEIDNNVKVLEYIK